MSTSKYSFVEDVKRALLADPQLVRLLGGEHVFPATEQGVSVPHIRIGHSESCERDHPQGASAYTVTLHIRPQTGALSRGQEIMCAAQNALANAMLVDGSVSLAREYEGSRRDPESREYQGILRYRAIRLGKAA